MKMTMNYVSPCERENEKVFLWTFKLKKTSSRNRRKTKCNPCKQLQNTQEESHEPRSKIGSIKCDDCKKFTLKKTT